MTTEAVRQSKARPVIFSLLTLLSGIVIGAGATLIIVGPPKEEEVPLFPEEFSRRMAWGMTRELDLTEEQREAIQQVIQTHMTVVEQYRQDAREPIQQELDGMNDEMLALLDENQQRRWKEQIERMNQWWRQSRERRGPRERDTRDRDRDGRGDRDDRERDRNRFRGPEGPGGDPNSPFFRGRRGGPPMNPDMTSPYGQPWGFQRRPEEM